MDRVWKFVKGIEIVGTTLAFIDPLAYLVSEEYGKTMMIIDVSLIAVNFCLEVPTILYKAFLKYRR